MFVKLGAHKTSEDRKTQDTNALEVHFAPYRLENSSTNPNPYPCFRRLGTELLVGTLRLRAGVQARRASEASSRNHAARTFESTYKL